MRCSRALDRAPEIKLHVKGALNNGVTVEEIKAALLHATAYCGIPARLDAFRAGTPLPKGYGFRVCERCVEVPWAVAHLRDCGRRVLDAGSTLNSPPVLRHPADAHPAYFVELTFVDGKITAIRDFRYVPYATREAAFHFPARS